MSESHLAENSIRDPKDSAASLSSSDSNAEKATSPSTIPANEDSSADTLTDPAATTAPMDPEGDTDASASNTTDVPAL
jgi:hypothetical protein